MNSVRSMYGIEFVAPDDFLDVVRLRVVERAGDVGKSFWAIPHRQGIDRMYIDVCLFSSL